MFSKLKSKKSEKSSKSQKTVVAQHQFHGPVTIKAENLSFGVGDINQAQNIQQPTQKTFEESTSKVRHKAGIYNHQLH